MQFTRVDESREICDEINTPRMIFKPARRYKTKLKIGAASCVKAFVASCVPYVRINDRSLRVTERLSRASHSLTLFFPPSISFRFLLRSPLPSLEVVSAKPSRRNLRYPIDFPAGMLQHRGRRGILLFN